MATIAIIPARGGSKGVPRKNVRLLADKPLIAHSILDAQEATSVDFVYVSTDDEEIATVSANYGAAIIERPPELANDTASSESALIHALQQLEHQGINPELLVFLQCTSPIRTGLDIDEAIAKLKAEKADSLLSVSPPTSDSAASANTPRTVAGARTSISRPTRLRHVVTAVIAARAGKRFMLFLPVMRI